MNKSRRHVAKRRRQVIKWRHEFNQLYKLWDEYDETWRSPNQYRRWWLMDKLGITTPVYGNGL